MKYPPKQTPRQKAEEHWMWLEGLLRKVYIDAFIHGYKHGEIDTKKGGK